MYIMHNLSNIGPPEVGVFADSGRTWSSLKFCTNIWQTDQVSKIFFIDFYYSFLIDIGLVGTRYRRSVYIIKIDNNFLLYPSQF